VRTLTLIRSGIASTIQDSGRAGHQRNGIPPSGAMDNYALRAGQYCFGHGDNEAALEFAYGDLAFVTSHNCRFIVTGAPTVVTIGNTERDSGKIEEAVENQVVTVKPRGQGIYSYLHVEGGFDTPLQLGSRSTSPRERIGGVEGRYLREGDTLPLGSGTRSRLNPCPTPITVQDRDLLSLRFVPGFQFDAFSPAAKQALDNGTFSVTPRANRMGIALEGDPVNTGVQSLLSEATCYGAVQIPPDGKPIILLNDRQTVGGYPKAGAVIEADCQRLVQSRPGQRVQLVPITPQEADRITWLEHHYIETKLS
jgi:biotin-dependent carboxylase-like uncharacterized protein